MKSQSFIFLSGVSCLALFALCSCVSSPQEKSARFIAAGKELMKKGDPARAVLQFQNAAKVTPKDPEAYYELATGFMAQGDAQRTVVSLRKALDLNPKHRPSALLLAKLEATVNDLSILQNAQESLKSMVQDTPDDPIALHTLALTELKLGNAQDALGNLNHALAVAPDNVAIAITMADAKLAQKDPKGAEEVLQSAVKNSPKSVIAPEALARLYLRENRLADAEQQFKQAVAIAPSDSAALFDLGIVQNQMGKKQEAEQLFRKLSVGPDTNMRGALAAFLFQSGRKDEGLRELQRLVKADASDRRSRTWLLKAYFSAGRAPEARDLLNQALKKNPKDSDALVQRSELGLQDHNLAQTESDLNAVLRLRPTAPEVHYLLAKLYQARKENSRSQQEYARALELNPYMLAARIELTTAQLGDRAMQAALDTLDAAPTAQKADPAWLAQHNWVLWAKGDLIQMRKGIDEGLATRKSPEILLQDGLLKLRTGNSAGARASLESALNIDPGDIRALAALEQTMSQQKGSSAGLEEIQRYAAQQPNSAPVQEFLGTTLAAHGLNDAAEKAFLAAKAADPQATSPELSLIQLDFAANKRTDAEQRLSGFLAVHGENATARLWMGNLKEMEGDHAAALDDFRKSVQADAGNAQALNNLAYLLSERDTHSEEALRYARDAVGKAPEHLAYYDTLGWVLYRRGLYSEAVPYLQRAANDKTRAVWAYHLAMAYAKTGDVERGLDTLQLALKQDPNIPEASQARQLLGQ